MSSTNQRHPFHNPLRPDELTVRDLQIIDYCVLLLDVHGVSGCGDVLDRQLRRGNRLPTPD
jgi:hypothetical protein